MTNTQPMQPRRGAPRKRAKQAPKSAADPSLTPNSIVSRSAAFIEPEARQAMICEAAYFLAEKRGFDPGHDVDDWLLAEQQIDQTLMSGDTPTECGDTP
jgi:hypothetical protein